MSSFGLLLCLGLFLQNSKSHERQCFDSQALVSVVGFTKIYNTFEILSLFWCLVKITLFSNENQEIHALSNLYLYKLELFINHDS